ncbi:TM1802 family CRISPR-associated protein [Desulfotomaculum copahuensis]|uniref:CRISPR-associated protein n=1 Tax=Desulfotomaculum copahuensis TaxID=1838280 RepID=A0A1B7LJJ8_9FIRM|nr:TM1802 family CRISPR-associated protein [Desulfotomaculum copahuensis]OAT86747.1 CRISPR-associated protein [Desulfotomaculum copahuensis]
MIDAARVMALDFLVGELAGEELPAEVEDWYQSLRRNFPGMMFPYLVEDSGRMGTVYILEKCADNLVRLSVQDIVSGAGGQGCTPDKLPFMRPSGSQSAQVGPVIKRSYDKTKGGGPSEKILITTMKYFDEVAQADRPWSPYFQDIVDILGCNEIRLPGGEVLNWRDRDYANMLACAVDRIGPQKGTVMLTVRDSKGLLPGENPLYLDYLLTEKLAGERYATKDAPAKEEETCCICGAGGVTVYPNALRGAGINLCNVDRAGAFPGVDTVEAWKRFALCGSCADLLYIYKFHVLKKTGPKKDRLPFSARIAGENALIIPSFLPGLPVEDRLEVLREVEDYIENMSDDAEQDEDWLLELLKDKMAVLNLLILWADIGQEIANVTGMIVDVVPSRLRELSEKNAVALNWKHPLFPKVPLRKGQADFKPDLSLRALRPLFWRPGGKKAEGVNKSKQLFQLKRLVAASVYRHSGIPEDRFWEEIMTTARWYWLEALEQKEGHRGLLYEGMGKKGPYLTAAGWVRHLNWWLYYFKQVGCMEMEKEYFKPGMEELRPYFGPESGINTPEKAFAFMLGVLYGKLLQVQGARGVNVGANALSWLKRLTLQGKDLPELYTKIREKLLAYETEKSEKVRSLISEIGHLGVKLGDAINLNETQTNYYLLLGQSMVADILPGEEKNKGGGSK